MDNNQTKQSLFDKARNETRKPGFIKALSVFFFCTIMGVVIGFIYDSLQLFSILGVGLGLIWMGVAYFNQKE
jgi:hypothetical protein